MRSEVLTVTPEMATKLLNKNKTNRPLSKRLVSFYCDSILKDQWALNGESIKLGSDGSLIDGQHRLSAVAMANKSIKTVVMYGIDNRAFVTIDQGKNRTFADLISFKTDGYLKIKASITLYLYKYNNNLLKAKAKASKVDLLDYYEKNKSSIDDAVDFIQNIRISNLPVSMSVLGFCYIIFGKNNKDAKVFIERLITGESLSSSDVIYMAREKLIQNRRATNKRDPFYEIDLIFRAFKHFVDRENVAYIRWATKGSDLITL